MYPNFLYFLYGHEQSRSLLSKSSKVNNECNRTLVDLQVFFDICSSEPLSDMCCKQGLHIKSSLTLSSLMEYTFL